MKISLSKIALYERLRETLDNRVSDVFDTYCQVTKTRRMGGVERWSVEGDQIFIVQDTSSRCGYDNEHHSLPASWLTIEDANERVLIIANYTETKHA